MIKNLDESGNDISRFKQEEIHPHFHAAAESARPLKQWAQGLKQECASHLESARTLNAGAHPAHRAGGG
jgi:hypothetical protein